jgi:hypothetical protein
MVIRKYEHSIVRSAILLRSPTVVVELILFLSKILRGDVGPRSFRTWHPRFVPGYPVL